jgi:nicotinamidase-related amidase
MNNKTFSHLFGFEHPPARLSQAVVIVIDMQREYRDGTVPLADLPATLAATTELITRAKKYNTPVIHVLNQGPVGNLLFNRDGPYFAELPEVAAQAGDAVVIKHLPNSFAGTNLKELIDRTGRKELIIVGYTTHVCVSATARAALDLGFQSTIIANATTSRDLLNHKGECISAEVVKQTALAELRDAFSVVVESADELLI